MIDEPDPPSAPADLAAEYALGVLTGDELRRARELAQADAQFRADVARWSGRLAPILDEAEAVAPPSGAWTNIQN